MDANICSDSPHGDIHLARATRRYTTMEGWRAARLSLHAASGIGFRFLAPSPQFDPEVFLDSDEHVRTRSSRPSQPDGSSVRSSGPRSVTVSEALDSYHLNWSIEPFSVTDEKVLDDVSDGQKDPVLVSRPDTPPAIAEEPPYHVFSRRRKWLVVVLIAVAGVFSGLSSNIYFPSLEDISRDLNVSPQTVSLTITSYLVIQGLSPLLWGSLSDALGRRPIYIASFAVYIVANIVLSFSPNFAVLLIFRGLQAAGCASTVSIGNGVIQDIAPPSERGALISFYQAMRNFSIAVGPVLGGILSFYHGFRSVFVFLFVSSGAVIIVIIVFLPETMRSITGNGSVRVGGIYTPLIYRITGEPSYLVEPDEPIIRKKITVQTFLDPLKLLWQKDVLLNLVFGGVIYTVWCMVTATTTSLFKRNFSLNALTLGCAFLPNGAGTIVGSTIVGNLMTRDYRSTEDVYKSTHNLPADYKLPSKDIPADFPIEKARLRHLPWISMLFVISTGAYGFTFAFPRVVSLPGWIAVPLSLQFMIAATSNAVFALNQTLVSDLCPGKGASSTAINNLVRCSLGALGVAVAETMLFNFGPALTFVLLAMLVIIVTPLAAANLVWGMEWRRDRIEAKKMLEAKKSSWI